MERKEEGRGRIERRGEERREEKERSSVALSERGEEWSS
jgi:hypothetical protein